MQSPMYRLSRYAIRASLALLALVLSSTYPFHRVPDAAAQATPGWPTFQHDFQRTGQATVTGPRTDNIRWMFRVPDDINAAPAVGSDGTIYLPIAGNDGRLLAISAQGCLKWQTTLIAGSATSPTIAPDGTIYIGISAGLPSNVPLYAINPDGSIKWTYSLPSNQTYVSPALGSDGTIYTTTTDGKLVAINPNGTTKWIYSQGASSGSSPSIGLDGTIYANLGDGLYAFQPNGTLIWKYSPPPPPPPSFPVVSLVGSSPTIGPNGTIYTASSEGMLFAISPSGVELWRLALEPFTPIDLASIALASDGTLYIGSDPNFYAVDSHGFIKWTYPTTRIRSSAIVGADGTIYVGTDDAGIFYAFNPDGTVLWSKNIGAVQVGAPSLGLDGTLYIGALYEPKALYAFGSPAPQPPHCTTSAVPVFDGFYEPVNNTPTLNQMKAGKAVRVKFSLGGDFGLNIFQSGYPASQAISCSTTDPIDLIEDPIDAASSSLEYNTSNDRYEYIWKTDAAWNGTCRKLILRLADGSEHSAFFKFK